MKLKDPFPLSRVESVCRSTMSENRLIGLSLLTIERYLLIAYNVPTMVHCRNFFFRMTPFSTTLILRFVRKLSIYLWSQRLCSLARRFLCQTWSKAFEISRATARVSFTASIEFCSRCEWHRLRWRLWTDIVWIHIYCLSWIILLFSKNIISMHIIRDKKK